MPLNSRAIATHLRAHARSAAELAVAPVRTSFLDALRATDDCDQVFLVGLYDQALRREPDADGFAVHLAALREGVSREDVIARIAGSDEAEQVLVRGARVDEVDGPDHLVAHGLAVLAGVVPTTEETVRLLARVRLGVPLSVLVHELDRSAGLEPWPSVLARNLLVGLPTAGDPEVVDRVLAKIGAREEPEAILALVMPGRRLLTRLRRQRRAARAIAYTTLQVAQAPGAGSTTVPAPAATTRAAREDIDRMVRRLTALEAAVTDARAQTRVHVVQVDAMLLGVPADEWRLAAYLEHRGHPEPGLAARMMPCLVPGATFVDVGANIGLYTVAAAAAVGRDGRVVALEPTPRTAAVLRENVQLNGFREPGTVEVHECAAGSGSGRSTLALHRGDSGHNTLFADGAATGAVEVDVVPLDDLVPPGTRVDVVKVDAEGAELEVLEGMRRLVQDNPDVVVFAELADEHLRRAGSSARRLLAEAVRLGWQAEVFETVSGEPAVADVRGVPLSVRLVRRTRAAS